MYFSQRKLLWFSRWCLTVPAFWCLTTMQAQAQITSSPSVECNHLDAYNSYIVLPSGQCLRMDYLTIMGQSGANLSSINTRYNDQFDLNVRAEANEYFRLLETEEERQQRYESLARTSLARDAVEADHQSVMGYLYPIHVEALGIIVEEYPPYQRFERR